MINGTLYNGQDDGHLYARSFDGTTFGAATSVDLNGLTASNFPIASLTGMAYVPSTGRLYYTVSGSTTLYYRYFEPEDNVVGGQTFTAGTLPAAVTSMTIVGGNIYYTTAAGLSSVAFVNGQASGSASLIASTGDWSGRGTVRRHFIETSLGGGAGSIGGGRGFHGRPRAIRGGCNKSLTFRARSGIIASV